MKKCFFFFASSTRKLTSQKIEVEREKKKKLQPRRVVNEFSREIKHTVVKNLPLSVAHENTRGGDTSVLVNSPKMRLV